MAYPIAKKLFFPLRWIWIRKINGIENLPKGPFIFAANHGSFLDDLLLPMIIITTINRYVHIYCNDEYFRNFFLRKFLEWGRVIPVRVYECSEKKAINKKAYKKALRYLQKGEPIGIFPEGHRSPDGRIKKAHTGIGSLAAAANVPVVPIGTKGTFRVWPKGTALPRLKKIVVIQIGKPFVFKNKNPRQITVKVMQEILKLAK
ncbi:MAG TPA: lysophospholipid acyltransferase family protein [Candidatus Nanoarchaeia archaeon]|nr:lysophospholipid acyltransferase family protein [Candidatus Nanoarchaeia archaeon]